MTVVYRFEIEKKLKRAKKKEMKEQKSLEKSMASNKSEASLSSSPMPLDLKDRVKERKKNVEENKGKGDKKVAMTLLKARREEKRERGKSTTFIYNLSIVFSNL